MSQVSFVLYLFGSLLISSTLFFLPTLGFSSTFISYYSNSVQILSAVVAAALCFRTSTVFDYEDPMRLVWIFMGAGTLSWGVGQALYTGYVIAHNGAEPPHVWYSDIGFLLMQPSIVVALLIFIRAMDVRPPIWGMVLALTVLIVATYEAYNSAKTNLQEAATLIESLVVLAFMLFDPFLLATTVLSTSVTGGALARSWWFCFSGLVLYYSSNRLFEVLSARDSYISGSWVDLGWITSFILIGIAALSIYNLLKSEE